MQSHTKCLCKRSQLSEWGIRKRIRKAYTNQLRQAKTFSIKQDQTNQRSLARLTLINQILRWTMTSRHFGLTFQLRKNAKKLRNLPLPCESISWKITMENHFIKSFYENFTTLWLMTLTAFSLVYILDLRMCSSK